MRTGLQFVLLFVVGWRCAITPEDHVVSEYEFDVLIGADGKRNTLQGKYILIHYSSVTHLLIFYEMYRKKPFLEVDCQK